MPALFAVNPVDRKVYEEKIRDFVPDRMVDVHTHVWREADTSHNPQALNRVVSWPLRVARE